MRQFEVGQVLTLDDVNYINSLGRKLINLQNEDSWRRNPDRMGGQFSCWEKNRRGDEFS